MKFDELHVTVYIYIHIYQRPISKLRCHQRSMKFDIYSGVLEPKQPKQPKQRRECIANAFDNSKLIEQLAIRVDATHTHT